MPLRRCPCGDGVAVISSDPPQMMETAHDRGGMMAAEVWRSEARSISHGLLQTHRRCQTAAHGRGVEFRSSKFKRLGVQRLGDQKGVV